MPLEPTPNQRLPIQYPFTKKSYKDLTTNAGKDETKYTVSIMTPLFVIGILLVLVPAKLKGQSDHIRHYLESPRELLKSPDAAGLGSYGNYNVRLATGTPGISIPIYTIQSGDLRFPVSLQYQATGIKVDQFATLVGLGWNLQATSVINRKVNGVPDDRYDLQNFIQYPVRDALEMINSTDHQQNIFYVSQVLNKIIDAQSDEYFFSIPGYAGKIVFGNDGVPFTVPHSPLKVEAQINFGNNPALKGFTLTDPQGIKYVFDQVEWIWHRLNSGDGGVETNTSFYLGQIESPTGDQINFVYKSATFDHHTYLSQAQYAWRFDGGPHIPGYANSIQTSHHQMTDPTINGYKVLEKITLANGELFFHSSQSTNARQDLPGGGHRLDVIELRDSEGSTLKTIDFEYSYFVSDQGDIAHSAFTKKLKLDKINFKDPFDNTVQHYELKYDTTPLPAAYSYGKDYWGYYNSKNGNNGVLPIFDNPWKSDGSTLGNADREPGTGVQYGMLNEIVYPTGGYTRFNFEPNVISRNSKNKKVVFDEFYLTYGETNSLCGDQSSYAVRTYQFTPQGLVNGATVSVDLTATFNLTAYPYSTCSKVSLVDKATDTEVYSLERSPFYTGPVASNVDLVVGNLHEVKVEAYHSSSNTAKLEVYYEYETNELIWEDVLGPGVRIESIVNYDTDNTTLRTRRFKYHYPSDPNLPSGHRVLDDIKSIFSYKQEYTDCGVGNNAYSTAFIILDKPVTGVPGDNDLSYYTHVTEFLEENGNTNGKIEYEFSFTGDVANTSSVRPFMRSDQQEKRGNLLNKKTYSGNVGNYTLQSEEIFNYSYVGVNRVSRGLAIHEEPTLTGNENDCSVNPMLTSRFALNNNLIISSWKKLDSKKVIVYENGSEFAEEFHYTYSDPSHAQLTRASMVDSKGKSEVTQYKYIADYTPGSLDINQMKTLHILSNPIEVFTQVDNAIVEYVITDYNGFGKPEAVYSLSTRSDLQSIPPYTGDSSPDPGYFDRLTQVSYENQRQRPVRTDEIDGISSCHVWRYDNSNIVVSAVNAGSAFEATVEEVNVLPSGYNSLESLLASLNDIVTNSTQQARWQAYNQALRDYPDNTGAMIYTYTYNPLIGMTSETDPRGLTVYYHYDFMGRLYQVKDHNGNVLRQYTYTYYSSN